MLYELKNRAAKEESSYEDLIERFIRQGLKNQNGLDTMAMVSLNETVVEKVNIKCKQIDCSPEDLINDILQDYLSDVEEIHDGLEAEKILAMLDHDKPKGDDVLEILSNVNKLK